MGAAHCVKVGSKPCPERALDPKQWAQPIVHVHVHVHVHVYVYVKVHVTYVHLSHIDLGTARCESSYCSK